MVSGNSIQWCVLSRIEYWIVGSTSGNGYVGLAIKSCAGVLVASDRHVYHLGGIVVTRGDHGKIPQMSFYFLIESPPYVVQKIEENAMALCERGFLRGGSIG